VDRLSLERLSPGNIRPVPIAENAGPIDQSVAPALVDVAFGVADLDMVNTCVVVSVVLKRMYRRNFKLLLKFFEVFFDLLVTSSV
jgi:hypothetical protein